MLSSADRDLIRRDASIPGLAAVLDAEAFLAALRRAAPGAEVRSARITYARYKPRIDCHLTYRVDVAGSDLDLDVHAWGPEGSWGDRCEGPSISGPLGPGRLVLEDRVPVTVYPNDLELPELGRLADPTVRMRLLEELLPGREDLWQGDLRCLRYRPERRYVAELCGRGGARSLLKACTRKAYPRSKRNATLFESRGALRVAKLLAGSDSRHLLAYEWRSGPCLVDICTAPEFDREAVVAVGVALGELHAQRPDGLACWTRADEVSDLLALSAEVGVLLPQLARPAARLARRLALEFAAAPAVHVPLHGDLSARHVLVGDDGVALVDLDWACCGDPADDLGNILAQAERYALRGEFAPARVEMLRGALLAGYARRTDGPLPERIGLYTAAELFRGARFPFRTHEPDWPQRTEALLERAEHVLDAVRTVDTQ